MPNYTIIHGNVIYKVKDVEYDSTNTHRRFLQKGKLVLSVPLSSVMVKDEAGVTAQIVNGLNSGIGFQSNSSSGNNTTVVHTEDNFIEGAIVGSVIGAILF